MANDKYIDKCKNCGGPLSFNVKSVSMECKSCGASYKIELQRATEEDYEDFIINKKINRINKHDTHTIKCNSCGAVDILNNGDLADICPFCGSSNIENSADNEGFSPNGIIPFEISKDEAYNVINNRIRTSKWSPKDFKTSFRATKVKGIYTPCFTFDVKVKGGYSAKVGRNYQKQVTINNQLTTITEIKWFYVNGMLDEFYDDILVDAGQKINGTTLEQLKPYYTNASIAYDRSFLNGYSANKHDKSLEISFQQAKVIIDEEIKDSIRKRHDADFIDSINLDVRYENVKYKYILLPVYTSSFTYKDKVYNLYVNGVTGKVVGSLPTSKGKIWGAVAVGLLVAATVGILCWLFL